MDSQGLQEFEAFASFVAGWQAALEKGGGFIHSYEWPLDWDRIRDNEFNKFWLEHNKIWETQMKMAEQKRAHQMALHNPNIMPIPTPAELNPPEVDLLEGF